MTVLSRSRFRQPLVFQDGNLRVWLFPSKTLQDLSLPSDTLEDATWQLVHDGTICVGCAVHVPPSSIPTQICRPDGSCGLQFAALARCEATTTWRPSLSTPEYFNSEESLSRFQSLLAGWLRGPLDSGTAGKVRGTLSWLRRRDRRTLPLSFWFSHVDVHRVLRGCPPVALWEPVIGLPDLSDWFLL